MDNAASLANAATGFFSRRASLFKVFGIFILALLLLIPVAFIDNLLGERNARRDEAVAEIASNWGTAQRIAGPVLVVPYRVRDTQTRDRLVNGRVVQTVEEQWVEQQAVFLPETLAIEGEVVPDIRQRGIYQAVVYTAELRMSGRFDAADIRSLEVAPADLLWDKAWMALGLSDLRGTQAALSLTLGGRALSLEPGTRTAMPDAGLHAAVSGLSAGVAPGEFSLSIKLNGSRRISFLPFARQTEVKLASTWADPGFDGGYLPSTREVADDGFHAAWSVPYYARDYGQQWTDSRGRPACDQIAKSEFGVELVRPVDSYRTVERSTKYALLFITLVFIAFFLFEVLASLRLNALHYLLVGAALVLFYLALLALSEFVAFGLAYLVAAAASGGLITGYSAAILGGGRRSVIIGGVLAVTYGTLWMILQMQDYALLAGTAALFAALAVIMFTTRHLDWTRQAPGSVPPPLPLPQT